MCALVLCAYLATGLTASREGEVLSLAGDDAGDIALLMSGQHAVEVRLKALEGANSAKESENLLPGRMHALEAQLNIAGNTAGQKPCGHHDISTDFFSRGVFRY
jgi:hypothetical protein